MNLPSPVDRHAPRRFLARMLLACGVVAIALAFGAVSASAQEASLPRADVLDVDFADGTPADRAQNLPPRTFGAPVVAFEESLGRSYASFDGSDDSYAYPLDYAPLADGLTVECHLRFDGELSTANHNVCSNVESGGFAVNFRADQLTFNFNTAAGTARASITGERDVWYHVVGVWTGARVLLYVDGQLAGEAAATGAIAPPRENSRFFHLGADSGSNGTAQFHARSSVTLARVYSFPVTAEQAQALYLDARKNVPAEVEAPQADVLDVDFADGTAADRAQDLPLAVSGAPAVDADEVLGRPVARFDGAADSYGYSLAGQYGKFADGVTVECLVSYDGVLPRGEANANLCSNVESGGFSLNIRGADLSFNFNTAGGLAQATLPARRNRWYHAVGVWDGEQIRLYVDGELVSQADARGAFRLPAVGARVFHLGADSGANGGVQFHAEARVSLARIFSSALEADQIRALHREALRESRAEEQLTLASTRPVADQHITSSVELAAEFTAPELLRDEPTLMLDGEPVERGAAIGPGLQSGRHWLSVEAETVFGTPFAHEFRFTTSNIPLPGSGRVEQARGRTTLLASAENPSGNRLVTTFTAADIAPADGVVQGVIEEIPTTLAFDYADGEQLPSRFGPGQENALASPTSAALPFQRYAIAADAERAREGEIVWTGFADPARQVALYAWSAARGAWQRLAATRGSSDGAVTLSAPAADEHVVDGAIQVLVVGEDPFADDLDEPVRDAFEDPADYDFSLSHLSDTQFLSQYAVDSAANPLEHAVWRRAHTGITDWIAANAAERKIAFAFHTGDVINNWHVRGTSESRARREFAVASEAQQRLDDAGVPNAVLPGNHDNLAGGDSGAGSLYNEYFGAGRYEALSASPSWQRVGASYHPWREGDNDNSYVLFTAGGLDFVAVSLGFAVDQAEVDWASSVLDQYSDRNAIVLTHAYNKPSTRRDGRGSTFANDGSRVFNGVVKKHENVFLVLSGHEHGVSITVRKDAGSPRHNVVELLADYQGYMVDSDEVGLTEFYGANTRLRLGASFFRLLQFDVDRSELSVDTYSPLLDDFGATEHDSGQRFNGQEDDFRLPIQLETRRTRFATSLVGLVTPTDAVIGEQTVASGDVASAVWQGLTPGRAYAWHFVSRDAKREAGAGLRSFGGIFFSAATGTDATAPVITVPTPPTVVPVGAAFDPLEGVEVRDDVDGDLRSATEVIGSVDSSLPGIYTLVYVVEDANGNRAVASRAVVVRADDESGPVPPPAGEPHRPAPGPGDRDPDAPAPGPPGARPPAPTDETTQPARRAKPRVTVGKVKRLRSGARATLAIRVSGPGRATPTGTVSFAVGRRTFVKRARIGRRGRVSVRLPALKPGRHVVRVRYRGDARHRPARSDAVTVVVRKAVKPARRR